MSMIRITCKREGYRRAGIAHSKTATDHAAERFSAAGLKQLQADPQLTVEILDAAEPATKPRNVAETVALVEACEDLAALTELADGESRKGVLSAIDKRRDELTAGDQE